MKAEREMPVQPLKSQKPMVILSQGYDLSPQKNSNPPDFMASTAALLRSPRLLERFK